MSTISKTTSLNQIHNNITNKAKSLSSIAAFATRPSSPKTKSPTMRDPKPTTPMSEFFRRRSCCQGKSLKKFSGKMVKLSHNQPRRRDSERRRTKIMALRLTLRASKLKGSHKALKSKRTKRNKLKRRRKTKRKKSLRRSANSESNHRRTKMTFWISWPRPETKRMGS
jgi:hypothetical protein